MTPPNERAGSEGEQEQNSRLIDSIVARTLRDTVVGTNRCMHGPEPIARNVVPEARSADGPWHVPASLADATAYSYYAAAWRDCVLWRLGVGLWTTDSATGHHGACVVYHVLLTTNGRGGPLPLGAIVEPRGPTGSCRAATWWGTHVRSRVQWYAIRGSRRRWRARGPTAGDARFQIWRRFAPSPDPPVHQRRSPIRQAPTSDERLQK